MPARRGDTKAHDEAEARYRDLAQVCDQPVIVCSGDSVVFVNDAGVGLLGATKPEQIVGHRIDEFFPSREPAPAEDARGAYAEAEIRRLDEETVRISMTELPCRYRGKNGVQIVVRDVGGRRVLERRVEFLTRHDILTEIPNRTEFRDRLVGAISRANRNERHVAVMLINIDRFKSINGKFGFDAGDHVLQTYARRLKDAIRASDSLARVGGDEFSLILEGLEQREQAAIVANRVLANLKAPIEIRGAPVEVTASAGVAAAPGDSNELDTLLRMTDVAMYAAKESQRGTFRFYFPDLEAVSHRDQVRHEQTASRMGKLTAREREVMDMMIDGNSNKAMAYLLGASPRTIENHRARVMEKMQADSLPDLVRMVLDLRQAAR